MSERLEQWKAREKLRSDIGWAAIYVGLCGIWVVVVGASLFAWTMTFEVESTVLGTVVPAPLAVGLVLAGGLALVYCAVGLWNARAWARWIAVVLLVVPLVGSVIVLVRDSSIDLWLPFWGFPVVCTKASGTAARPVSSSSLAAWPSTSST